MLSNPAQEAREKAAILERVGRYREAAHVCHLALVDAPDDSELLCGLAYNYYRLGERWRAGEYVAQALAADPNNERVHRLRCLLVLGQGKKAAIEAALRAVELDPTGRHPLSLLVRSYLAAEEIGKARDAALDLVRLFPNWATSHELLGDVAFQMEKWEASEKSVRMALSITAESSEAHLLLGQALYASDKPHEAADSFLNALKLEPRSRIARRGLILCVVTARRYFRLCLDLIPLALVLTLCFCPILHFASWQSFAFGFSFFSVIGFVKIYRSRLPLSPDVEAAWQIEKMHRVRLVFLCFRAMFGK